MGVLALSLLTHCRVSFTHCKALYPMACIMSVYSTCLCWAPPSVRCHNEGIRRFLQRVKALCSNWEFVFLATHFFFVQFLENIKLRTQIHQREVFQCVQTRSASFSPNTLHSLAEHRGGMEVLVYGKWCSFQKSEPELIFIF